ncbi:MAG: indole-3-glycerol phosphate synthase TrpC [Candidatus Oxydemutatoraceae bacterium WSBS_2016_MAG_OTU14]
MKSNILTEILAHKREEIVETKSRYSIERFQDIIEEQGSTRGFLRRLQQAKVQQSPAVIAELKRASPSKGILREDFNPLEIAQSYMMAGASCLSVLTDARYFKGSGTILDFVRKHCPLPALRKDFIIDPYQIYESRAYGADCILLIAAALSAQEIDDLHGLATEQGMDVLVEVHDEAELDQVLGLGDKVQLIGINNRNLNTFEVDIQTTVRLAQNIPENKLIVSESGIAKPEDIAMLKEAGVYVYLVGESLLKAKDPGAQLHTLLGTSGWS